MIWVAVVAAAVATLGCALSSAPIPAPPSGGSVMVGPDTALDFQQHVGDFYGRLTKRRFNALETFNDAYLREHFRNEDGFFNYYASLATALQEAHFSKSRPTFVDIQEFLFETPNTVRVQVLYEGKDARPLRGAASVDLILLDTWELTDRGWWLVPGKL
ncbi:MAG: hypothetical protein QF890_11545 [Myxococcota bacterium]|nr:hypothetical protein [bacterium]MDP6244128.1 hypothetical protein [Myxococcota bacterium]MDP7074942.1 hypothetical protein [Myxococcota bacterium]MDP7298986.1 hypothetical protein [Myxococcota bacterium]MDP7433191.1 hypothetical protein [Myxococcota bacterium]